MARRKICKMFQRVLPSLSTLPFVYRVARSLTKYVLINVFLEVPTSNESVLLARAELATAVLPTNPMELLKKQCQNLSSRVAALCSAVPAAAATDRRLINHPHLELRNQPIRNGSTAGGASRESFCRSSTTARPPPTWTGSKAAAAATATPSLTRGTTTGSSSSIRRGRRPRRPRRC